MRHAGRGVAVLPLLQQPPGADPNYYEFFGLHRHLSSIRSLAAAVLRVEPVAPPDRYTRRSEQEKHYLCRRPPS